MIMVIIIDKNDDGDDDDDDYNNNDRFLGPINWIRKWNNSKRQPLRKYLIISSSSIKKEIDDTDNKVDNVNGYEEDSRCVGDRKDNTNSMLLIQDTINQSLSLPSSKSSSVLLTSSSSNDIHYVNSEVINIIEEKATKKTELNTSNSGSSSGIDRNSNNVGFNGALNSSVHVDVNSTTEMIIRGDAVVKLLIAQSNRGHDIGAEGIWDSVSAHTIEEINQLNSSQRKEAHKEKRLKRLSMWDQTLDQGHVKKIKKISSSEVDYHDGGSSSSRSSTSNSNNGTKHVNSFQVVADSRLASM